jgi:hypothetical protein
MQLFSASLYLSVIGCDELQSEQKFVSEVPSQQFGQRTLLPAAARFRKRTTRFLILERTHLQT